MRSYMGNRIAAGVAFVLLTLAAAAACAGGITELDIAPPPPNDFGFGPRWSADSLYVAQVRPLQPIRVGRMHTWRLDVQLRSGSAVSGATITVAGSMPQHGHGLPTKPRVTKELGDGSYEVEGMRFNMGGWWIVTFRIVTPAGTDVVTFNLSL